MSDAELLAICNKVEGEMIKKGKKVIPGEIYKAVKPLISDKDKIVEAAKELSKDPNFIRFIIDNIKNDKEFREYIESIINEKISPILEKP
ncbi:hypothetical protein [Acidianus sp. RZ1]|uniref:hypothetical protein n=1 Tax=Acidianus sp. RZ1 TaxID=1540082 RepID=UPI001491F4C6|nr:hypothetical protein [Acidianus sp. RZ1]NON61280.1 hypothetical protein [Acidianus sp. RZ1]